MRSRVNLDIIKKENPELYAKIIKKREYMRDYIKRINPIKGN